MRRAAVRAQFLVLAFDLITRVPVSLCFWKCKNGAGVAFSGCSPIHIVLTRPGLCLRWVGVLSKAAGDITGACEAMLEVYVETYGALSKREKIDFILEQMRLCILKQAARTPPPSRQQEQEQEQ